MLCSSGSIGCWSHRPLPVPHVRWASLHDESMWYIPARLQRGPHVPRRQYQPGYICTRRLILAFCRCTCDQWRGSEAAMIIRICLCNPTWILELVLNLLQLWFILWDIHQPLRFGEAHSSFGWNCWATSKSWSCTKQTLTRPPDLCTCVFLHYLCHLIQSRTEDQRIDAKVSGWL